MKLSPILITGAGPTGLVLALWLTKAGVPVRLIDKTKEPGTTTRAMVFHVRNLEFYRQMGIEQAVLEGGVKARRGNMWLRGERVGSLRFAEPAIPFSRFNSPVIFPQDLHEHMLVEQLAKLGVQVERETELLDFTQSAEGIRARLRKANGETETFDTPYLAGCDGARSTVREGLDVGFSGGTYSDVYYVADIVADGPVINGELNIALDDADFLAVFPMRGEGRARLVGAVRGKQPEGRELRWEDVHQRIIEHLRLQVHEVKWFSTYRVHHRVASAFRQGRVFLLGDAAHVHSPVGGQGMNTGIGDAINLAWKLAATLKGESPARLLDTFEPERIAFARILVATTDRWFGFINARGPLATWVRTNIVPHLVPWLFSFTRMRNFVFRALSQIAIEYPQSDLSHGPEGTGRGGKRLPWVQVGASDNFAPLDSRQWQIHQYGYEQPGLRELCEARGIRFHLFRWTPFMRKAGLWKNAAYLIRPDGHVAIIDPRPSLRRIEAYLDKWLPRTRESGAGAKEEVQPQAGEEHRPGAPAEEHALA